MTLDDLAPWPRAADQVTAEALVRYFAVVAHASALAGEHESAACEYGVALELRVLQIFAPARADEAARVLWRRLENPPPEGLTTALLLRLGIDPAVVAEACPGSLVAHQGRAGGGDGASERPAVMASVRPQDRR